MAFLRLEYTKVENQTMRCNFQPQRMKTQRVAYEKPEEFGVPNSSADLSFGFSLDSVERL